MATDQARRLLDLSNSAANNLTITYNNIGGSASRPVSALYG